MTVEEARAFLRTNSRAVLATFRGDGRPQLSPVLATIDGEGRVVVSTRETAMKTRNLRRDSRVSLCAFGPAFFGQWVQVDGIAEIVSLPEAMGPLEDYYRRISGEHPDWEDYRRGMRAERRVLVRFAIERAGPTVAG